MTPTAGRRWSITWSRTGRWCSSRGAGLGTIAGGLGITWRSAAGSLEHLSLDVVRPLWEAQLDDVVAARLTPVPQRSYLPGAQRPRRWRRAWRELRNADPQALPGAPATPDPSQADAAAG